MRHFKHPATIISMVALFAALSGGAIAGTIISGSQIRNHSIARKKLTAAAIKALSDSNALAEASGLVAWTSDPGLITTRQTNTSGSIHGGSVYLDQGDTIHWLAEFVLADGSGMTQGAYAIYDSKRNLVAQTANTPRAFERAPVGTKGAWVKLPLTSPYSVPASGRYYFVDFVAGTTRPSVGVVNISSGFDARNVLPNGVRRGVRGGASPYTAFPSTLTSGSTNETRCILAG